jgi:ABC-type sugar transport system ATPase subunit
MLVEVRDITKRFGGTTALSDVTIDIAPGSVHGLIGENGAGKSTLGKIIGGAIRPDGGQVIIDGVARSFHSPRDASRAGIALITQDLALVPHLSVQDNVLLGIEPTVAGLMSRRASEAAYEEATRVARFELPRHAPVWQLSIADQQKVEILRAISRKAQVVVMDEPTSSLTIDETANFHRIVRDLKSSGTTIIYVSHFIAEILDLADDVTVLRNGRVTRSGPAAGETSGSLIRAMIGVDSDGLFPPKARLDPTKPVALSVNDLTSPGLIEDVSFEIRAGEIVGLAGLVGSGRTSVARAIFGADPGARGTTKVFGATVHLGNPGEAIRQGLAFVPEDRKNEGLELVLSQLVNVTLPYLDTVSKLGTIEMRRERKRTAQALKSLDVRPIALDRPVSELSGGNQQKVLFAKWLFGHPRVLLLDEPTRGVDVGARRSIHELICSLAEGGMAILLISSDLDEVLALSHRVLVMRAGRLVAQFTEPLEPEDILAAAFGEGTGAMSA